MIHKIIIVQKYKYSTYHKYIVIDLSLNKRENMSLIAHLSLRMSLFEWYFVENKLNAAN